MNHRIFESIITTVNSDGSVQIAPMGIWQEDGHYVLAPFRPSRTLDNVMRTGTAVVNFIDDVRIFAGCLTGRYDWPVSSATKIVGLKLDAALTHIELEKVKLVDDELRPRFHCRQVLLQTYKPFMGFNRAQSAVVELAILVSRLDMLMPEKIRSEISYLTIAIEKTAGPQEREAWQWLIEKVDDALGAAT